MVKTVRISGHHETDRRCGVLCVATMALLAFTLAGCSADRPAATRAVEVTKPTGAIRPEPYRLQLAFPGKTWTQAAPATHGFSSALLDSAVAYAQKSGSTSGMVVHDGIVLAQWGDISRKSNIHSVRKSLMSALVGIAVARGQLDPDKTLMQFGIDDNAPALSPEEKRASLRMLLEARSGVYHPSVYETAGMQAARPLRYSHLPGTFWYYNNWDFNTVGAIYEKTTGISVFDALRTEIGEPIGMQDYRPSDGHYVSGGSVTRYPAYPLKMSTRDLARFALLYLRNGRWGERQVIPASWVSESTQPWSDTATGGYGYMWWTSLPASPHHPAKRLLLRPTFWADGYRGQYAVVVPSLDLVVVNLVDSRLTAKRMRQVNMARLVWLVEAADGASDIGSEPDDD